MREATARPPVAPPVAKRLPHRITQHGQTRVDEYFWLRDRDDPDTLAYLKAENEYTEAMLAPSSALREQLYQEMLARIQQSDVSAPVVYGGWRYYTRTEEGQPYAIYCRKAEGQAEPAEQVLLDLNEIGRQTSYLRLGNFALSPDHQLLAYSLDTSGDEVYVTRVKDLVAGTLLRDAIPNSYYGLEWGEDGRTLYYVTLDEAKRPHRLWRHVLGSALEADELLYEEEDERFHLTIAKSRSRRYLWIQLDSAAASEVRYLEAADPASQPRLFAARQHDVEYELEHHGNRFFLRTTEGGRNYRVLTCPVDDVRRENWVEWLPHRESVMVEGVDAFARHIVVTEREDGLRRLVIHPVDGAPPHPIAMPEAAYTLALGENPEFDTALLRFEYTSLVTPRTAFDYHMDTCERVIVKQTPVLGGYDPANYETARIWARSADGAAVPLSLVWRKGLRRDGSHPALLYGYGSYGIPSDAAFSSDRVSLLDRGFVYAIAHIRGGADLGKRWHDEGKLLKKWNTFRDFVAAAEKLIADGYTSADRLAILGGSAGGLLVGAVINERPDLFCAAVAKVPFVDVLNTATDPTLPLTVIEYDEWGDSNQREYWEYIASYSPYDNVRPQRYPHLLITAGWNDPRVSYWEPAKWTAKLRALKTDDNLLLLRTNLDAGHGGASGRYERLRETAIDYAFLLQVMPGVAGSSTGNSGN